MKNLVEYIQSEDNSKMSVTRAPLPFDDSDEMVDLRIKAYYSIDLIKDRSPTKQPKERVVHKRNCSSQMIGWPDPYEQINNMNFSNKDSGKRN